MKKKHVIRDLEQLRALKAPMRQYIVTELAFGQEYSASDLAIRLNCSQESLQFHIKKLLDVGLIKDSGKRYINNRTETLYQLIACTLSAEKKSKCEEYRSLLAEVYSAAFRTADRALSRQLTESDESEFLLTHVKVRLRPNDAKEVVRRLEELKEFIKDKQDPAAKESQLITFAISKN